jgi:uncharacterized protein (TIGR03435 family)
MRHLSKFTSVALLASRLLSQSPAVPTSLRFEVASIKQSAPDRPTTGGIRPAPGGERYIASYTTLRTLLTVAYHIKAEEIIGGPEWMETERYDMNAKAEKPSNIEELHMMLRNLLAEEFKLRFHRETRELPVYALTVDKDGPKLTRHESPSTGETAGKMWIADVRDPRPELALRRAWHATQAPMDLFALRLGEIMDRPVLNLTHLEGSYDFDLSFIQAPGLPPGVPDGTLKVNGVEVDTTGPSIIEAVRKLGLRLERQKGPVEIMVIEHAEKPSAN